MTKPLALDLCCGLGGWAEGLIAVGWDVVGVDVDPVFETDYPGKFILADAREVSVDNRGPLRCLRRGDGGQYWGRPFSLVVASPPCQEFSRHDQPWTRKINPPEPDKSIWQACERIAREAGIPLILENVRGAQKFMGRARWHVGPYYLWGDVPALMPRLTLRKKESRTSSAVAERSKVPFELAFHIGQVFYPHTTPIDA